VLPKISENFLVITWILTLSPNFHRHLRSIQSPRVCIQRFQRFCSFWKHSLKCAGVRVFSTCCDFTCISSMDTKRSPFNRSFILGNTYIAGGQVSLVGRVRNSGHIFFCLSGIPSQRVRCVQEHCHCVTTSLRSSARMRWHYPVTVQRD
jgi:hypothetical protein